MLGNNRFVRCSLSEARKRFEKILMLTLQIKATTSPHGCIQLFQPRSGDNHNLFGKVPLKHAFPFSGVSSAGGSQRPRVSSLVPTLPVSGRGGRNNPEFGDRRLM
jgi:hypothetical protein